MPANIIEVPTLIVCDDEVWDLFKPKDWVDVFHVYRVAVIPCFDIKDRRLGNSMIRWDDDELAAAATGIGNRMLLRAEECEAFQSGFDIGNATVLQRFAPFRDRVTRFCEL